MADVQEMNDAARLYHAGEFDMAQEKLQPLAAQNLPSAQFLLGNMYVHGQGVERNDETARQYYLPAAQAGNPQAQSRDGFPD